MAGKRKALTPLQRLAQILAMAQDQQAAKPKPVKDPADQQTIYIPPGS